MKLLKADHETRYQVPGVPGLVRKPVNLDGAATGFTRLRSLRLYQFEAGSVIDGHAEEDEVFVIVTAGSVEMKIGFTDEVVDGFGTFTLKAPDVGTSDEAFVAYLPPHSVYRMTPHTAADVSYARATPVQIREPAVFHAGRSGSNGSVDTLLRNHTHADRLRLKVMRVEPEGADLFLQPVDQADGACEALVHLQGGPSATRVGSFSRGVMAPLPLESWDTVALAPGETPVMQVGQGSAVTIVTVLAC